MAVRRRAIWWLFTAAKEFVVVLPKVSLAHATAIAEAHSAEDPARQGLTARRFGGWRRRSP
ncbi:hypothetical protein LNP74_25815 [Klebsiella pneumoniae subsp. pneumoniae]|nr:hypothetical protein [Klebsiella pneumoniae subsp. pneumoniae]